MKPIEDAQHDITDAAFSLATAIDVLATLEEQEYTDSTELAEVIRSLREMQGGLERTASTLRRVSHTDH